MIDIRGVTKRYTQPVLHPIDASVERGRFVGIVGPNGSGKSTLLRMVSGVEPPDAGHIVLHGKRLQDYTRQQLAQKVAVVTQEPLPPCHFSVHDVVSMGRYPHENAWGFEPQTTASPHISSVQHKTSFWHMHDREMLISTVLEHVGLTAHASKMLDQLSGGERQRVAIAKAMVQQPQILLLDEPLSNLDLGYQVRIMALLRQWQCQTGLTVLIVLHDLNMAALYCDTLWLLHQGVLVAQGAPCDVLHPQTIERTYDTPMCLLMHPTMHVPQLLFPTPVIRNTV